jgi:Domain of unknown function (DUF6487)
MSVMPSGSLECPKCGGSMVLGFVPDFSEGGVLVGHWYEGRPKRSVWTGIKGLRASREKALPIGAFRCSGCGFVELYSGPQFEIER